MVRGRTEELTDDSSESTIFHRFMLKIFLELALF